MDIKITEPSLLPVDYYGPKYATQGSAGFVLIIVEYQSLDCPMAVRYLSSFQALSGSTYKFYTGVAVAIPENHVGLLTLRSSVASRGVIMLNGVGIIDSDYRGEVWGLVGFLKPYNVKSCERFFQLTVVPSTQQPITY